MIRRHPRPRSLAAALLAPALLLAALLLAACNSGTEVTPTPELRNAGSEATSSDDTPAGSSTDTDASAPGDEGDGADETFDFPTGDAVLVSTDYRHPQDRVDNTGAYLPANGKPTVVFVDAIW